MHLTFRSKVWDERIVITRVDDDRNIISRCISGELGEEDHGSTVCCQSKILVFRSSLTHSGPFDNVFVQ